MTSEFDEAFRLHRRFIWGVCYRMTGSAADADDVVQDTFTQALSRPPTRLDEPLRPWLITVALNRSRDLLRRRRRRRYTGSWLPSPVEVELADEGTEARYSQLESVSYAFLLALEALTPQQRAVLIMRDVLDFDTKRTADALGVTTSNVKVSLHRARKRMAAYDQSRRPPTEALVEKTREVVQRFMMALMTQDVPAIEALLTEDVRSISDGGGEFFAALKPVVGAQRVLKFFLGVLAKGGPPTRVQVKLLNGTPAVVLERQPRDLKEAPLVVTRFEISDDGRICEIHSILATRKLTAISAST